MTIDIIGGGIGGLTLAIALKRKNIAVRVFEEAAMIRSIGAGINLANNAMQVYQILGLQTAIENAGQQIHEMHITTPSLKPLNIADLRPFEQKYGVSNTTIHRADLQDILINELDEDEFFLGKTLMKISGVGPYTLYFSDGTITSSDCLIGADGIHSTVREHLFGDLDLRFSRQYCWRGIAHLDLADQYQTSLIEAWGSGLRFGFVPVAKGKVYWYALKAYEQGDINLQIEQLATIYKDFHPLVNELFRATPFGSIHGCELSDLSPIKEWYKGHICLLGDAAHATTPNLGQGACQAIEDAHILAGCLDQYPINKAFSQYQKLRQVKALKIVDLSWKLGQMAHWQHPMAVFLRNLALRATPKKIGQRQSAKIFQLAKV